MTYHFGCLYSYADFNDVLPFPRRFLLTEEVEDVQEMQSSTRMSYLQHQIENKN